MPKLFKLPIEKNLANLENESKLDISKQPLTVKVSNPKLFLSRNNSELECIKMSKLSVLSRDMPFKILIL